MHPHSVPRAVRLAVLVCLCGATVAHADDQLPEVIVQTSRQDVESAKTQSPTLSPLDVTQPTTDISQYFIQNNLPLTSNFTEIVAIAPSVQSVSPNGPGLLENQTLSIRGFTDGQFDVTFDGIPFQDSNDFTHHSTSYFMANDLDKVEIQYGPGDASTIGDATFCCSIDNRSRAPQAVATLTPYVSFGSFHSYVEGASFDTGRLENFGGAAGFIDVESSTSGGELSNMGQDRKNIFVKFEAPVATGTVLTFVGMYNQIHQFVGLGATCAEIGGQGSAVVGASITCNNPSNPTFGLSSDPASQAYNGYNQDMIHTDFEYVGLESKLGNWLIDNKVYTYAYYHTGYNGEDPNGETPNGTYFSPTDVPGNILENNYRSWGDTFNAKYKLGSFGDLKAGFWFERQANFRSLDDVDFTLGGAINPDQANYAIYPPGTPNSPVAQPGQPIQPPTQADILGAYYRLLNQTLYTFQPYVMLDWNALPGLTLSPGVRLDHFERQVDAIVNVKDAAQESYANVFNSTLPSFVAHYTISASWAAYLQAAKGFLAPNENFFNNGPTAVPGSTTLQPQTTWSYQLGTSYQTNRLAVSGDVYLVDFNNEIFSQKFGANTIFYNGGGTKYKGIETTATYYLGGGLSLYGNGSINEANDDATGDRVVQAPTATAAAGLIYNLHGIYASLLDKYVGSTYWANPSPNALSSQQALPAYNILNAALGYTFVDARGWLKDARISIDLSNLLNNTSVYEVAGGTLFAGTPLYWTIPVRSFNVNLFVPIK